ncbi:hypothetical protein HGA13_10910 [Nocardia speluncae]|uniref:Uncharacterized protein n=1 Tax=Nocardia speluncae TaxID=419477 RepID=A0A846XBA3_9NOCA|nr:hypothetical protein [Nocardia speluncae]NKY33581.1 hypothetical protein [Nocardia speluncae]
MLTAIYSILGAALFLLVWAALAFFDRSRDRTGGSGRRGGAGDDPARPCEDR